VKPDLTDIPKALAARPRDEKRGLPIPYANVFPDGSHDFTVIAADASLDIARRGICGLCGVLLDAEVAFLGGVRKEDGIGVYTDPPMHEGCAVAATKLCPHLRLSQARRVKEERQDMKGIDIVTGPGWSETKPPEWHLTIWRGYAVTLHQQVLCYVPGVIRMTGFDRPFSTDMVRERVFTYDAAGLLSEEDTSWTT
jgi:hypothetical protein